MFADIGEVMKLGQNDLLLKYTNDNIYTSQGQSGSAVYVVKHHASTLAELMLAFEQKEIKLDHDNLCQVGIHDGSSDGVTNYAVVINRDIFYTFVVPALNNFYRSLWPNEQKENVQE